MVLIARHRHLSWCPNLLHSHSVLSLYNLSSTHSLLLIHSFRYQRVLKVLEMVGLARLRHVNIQGSASGRARSDREMVNGQIVKLGVSYTFPRQTLFPGLLVAWLVIINSESLIQWRINIDTVSQRLSAFLQSLLWLHKAFHLTHVNDTLELFVAVWVI